MKGIPGFEPEPEKKRFSETLRRMKRSAAVIGAIGAALVGGLVAEIVNESKAPKSAIATKKHQASENYLQMMHRIQAELNDKSDEREAPNVTLDMSAIVTANVPGSLPEVDNSLRVGKSVGELQNPIFLGTSDGDNYDAVVNIVNGKAKLQLFTPEYTMQNYPPYEAADIGIRSERSIGFNSNRDIALIFEDHTFGNPSRGDVYSSNIRNTGNVNVNNTNS